VTQAKTIPGVTRVFVLEVTALIADVLTPTPGAVTIYFMRDNDSNTIPGSEASNKTKDKILEITPANTVADDVYVQGPVPATANFTFSALSPDTTTMRSAVSANLEQFFKEKTEIGETVVEEAYNAAIFNTLDTTNGDVIQSFTLSIPAGDIVVASGEIAVLGDITYP
jgi:hypothetical protein